MNRGQKYQNTVAFKHNKNSKKTRKILAMPINNLCSKCTEQIEWRKKYRKYKPLTVPAKCTKCLLVKVRDAYHILCDDCAAECCAKCLKPKETAKEVPAAQTGTEETLSSE